MVVVVVVVVDAIGVVGVNDEDDEDDDWEEDEEGFDDEDEEKFALRDILLETLLLELCEDTELVEKLLLVFCGIEGLLDEEEQEAKLVECEL